MAVKRHGVWAELDLDPTNDEREIRRAYARRLKIVHPEDDPAGFQRLRKAFDQAANMARGGWAVRARRTTKAATPIATPFDSPDRPSDDDADEATGDAFWPEEADRWDVAPPLPPEPLDPEVAAVQAQDRALKATHQSLCDTLLDRVNAAIPDGQQTLAALIAVFRSPAMDSLDTHQHTEFWLAHLVGHGGPAVEPLVEPTIQFFGWDSGRLGLDLRHAQPVLDRRDAARALDALARPGHPQHAAFQALDRRRPPWKRRIDRLNLDLERKVRDLLDRMGHDLPHLEPRLDAEEVAWWRAHLSRPRLAGGFLIALIVLPPTIALLLGVAEVFGPANLATFAALTVVLFSSMLAGGVAYVWLVARPARAWREGDPWSRPMWRRFGWAPAAVALPVLAGVLPPSPWLTAAVWLAVAALIGWTRVATAHVRRIGVPFDWSRYVGGLPLLIFLGLAGEILMPRIGGLAGAAIGAMLVLQVGADALADERDHASSTARRGLFAGFCAALVLVAAVLFIAPAEVAGLAAGLVVALGLADRALVWNRDGRLPLTRRFVLLFGWAGGFVVAGAAGASTGVPHSMLIGFGAWILSAVALTAASTGLWAFDIHLRLRKSRRAPGQLG